MAKTKKHLTKSKDKVFLGVFGGIADYFGLDETLVRIIGILIFVFTGFSRQESSTSQLPS